MPSDDDKYYRRRLLQEEEAARQATCDAAVERHEELADAYRLRLHCAPLNDLPSPARGPFIARPTVGKQESEPGTQPDPPLLNPVIVPG